MECEMRSNFCSQWMFCTSLMSQRDAWIGHPTQPSLFMCVRTLARTHACIHGFVFLGVTEVGKGQERMGCMCAFLCLYVCV